jgi:hypothetical protein
VLNLSVPDSHWNAKWLSILVKQVDVARGDGLLEVRIVCANRPGLLVDVMEAVEARGLTIVQVRIACRDEIVVEYLTLEVGIICPGLRHSDSHIELIMVGSEYFLVAALAE